MTNPRLTCPICMHREAGLIPAPRHVPAWDDLTGPEQMAMLAEVGAALGRGTAGFVASSNHDHFHLREASGARLTTGGRDPLLPLLAERLDTAQSVDLAIAFAMDSGVALLEPWFRELLARGGRLRIVVGDYLDTTDPTALARLLDLEGAELFVFETVGLSFHPKAWLFRAADARGAAIVGSSNLSQSALTDGVEWNLHSEDAADSVAAAFDDLLVRPEVKPLTAAWIEDYAKRRRARPMPEFTARVVAEEGPPPEPHTIQQEALAALTQSRLNGHRAGLVVLATGLGKTWLAAFDTIRARAGRILFVAHRDEILTQAMAAFRKVRPEAKLGRYTGTEKEADAEILFASIQTLGRVGHLRQFDRDHFEYIVVDEFHHAAARTYQKLIEHFTPGFLLGLTATPDRTDGADLLGLCGENLVYECDLFRGIDAGHLSPFHYFGVPDDVDYAQIPWRSGQFDPTALDAALATEARALNALDQYRKRASGPAIGFCCSSRLVRRLRDTPCTDPDCGWCQSQNDPKALLKHWFGFNGFRPNPAGPDGRPLQETIVGTAMAKTPLLGILPTGTGKSVCYQLPALSQFTKTGALTVVISPLVALMADQVEGMRRQGITSCVTINGMLSMPERQDALNQVRLGDAAILLISPEQLRSPSVRSVLSQREVGYWVLDEAHCVSKWGHDFRPDYRYVGRFIKEYSGGEGPAPVICLTATAKPDVIRDITDHFRDRLSTELALLDGGAVRENLSFEIVPTDKGKKLGDVVRIIKEALPRHGTSGAIVYCSTRSATERVAAFLKERGFAAAHYHAGLSPEQKRDVQMAFPQDRPPRAFWLSIHPLCEV